MNNDNMDISIEETLKYRPAAIFLTDHIVNP